MLQHFFLTSYSSTKVCASVCLCVCMCVYVCVFMCMGMCKMGMCVFYECVWNSYIRVFRPSLMERVGKGKPQILPIGLSGTI